MTPTASPYSGRTGRRVGSLVPGRLRGRRGLSLVELIVAMLVLAIGVLGMAAGTGWMIRTVELARMETARGAALQSAVEDLRGTPWNDLADGQETFGDFTVRWAMVTPGFESRMYRFEIVGPGRTGLARGLPVLSNNASTTLEYWINRR